MQGTAIQHDGTTVRSMRPDDRPHVLALVGELGEWFDEDARGRAIPIDLSHQRCLVAEMSRQIVGFITLYIAEGRLHIGWMAVRRNLHRHGIGRALLAAAEAQARSLGIIELAVYTLGESVDYAPYTATRQFYLATGFRPSCHKMTDNPGCPEELHLIKRASPEGQHELIFAVVRQATEADLPSVAALCLRWAAEGMTRNYRADTVDELRKRLGECCLVAELDGQVIGFVIGELRSTAGNEFVEGVLDDAAVYLEVQDLYVASDHRGRGVGTQLMRRLLQIANDRGVSGSLVYSANRDYARTARFYESLGYDMWHIHMTRGGRKQGNGSR